jgi:hypothetical protein
VEQQLAKLVAGGGGGPPPPPHAQAATAEYQAAKAAFERDNADTIKAMQAAAGRVQELDAQVRATAVDLWQIDGTNHPTPGVSIKSFLVLKYGTKNALKWAMGKGIALALDVKAFEEYAKAADRQGRLEQDGLDGIVTIETEPRAQIATDLAGVLRAVGVDAPQG